MFNEVFRLVQIDVIKMLGEYFDVIDGQELEEGRGGELEVYLHSKGVDEFHPALFFRQGVVPEEPGPADGDLWVHVAL